MDAILMNIDWMAVASYVITFVLGLGVLAPFVLKLKDVLKEVSEFLLEVNEALQDGKITKAEFQDIVEQLLDIVGVFKGDK